MQHFIYSVFSFGLFLVCTGCGSGAENPPTFDTQVQTLQQQYTMPALVVGTVGPNQVQIAQAGHLSVVSPQKINESDPLPLGSDSKAITASLIARFVEQGRLHWNDKVVDWLPALASGIHPSYQTLTIEQLLRHESGLAPLTEAGDVEAAILNVGGLSGDVAQDQLAVLRWFLALPARFAPGGQTEYGNLNYVLAGYIAEQAGQDSYEHLVQREVFSPLGIIARHGPSETSVSGHRWLDHRWQIKAQNAEMDYVDHQLALAAGGWWMSMPDYVRFLQAHMDGIQGKNGWLLASTVQYLHRASGDSGMGMGWQLTTVRGETFSQHLGSDEDSYVHGAIFSHKTGYGAAFFSSGYRPDVTQAVSDFAVSLTHTPH